MPVTEKLEHDLLYSYVHHGLRDRLEECQHVEEVEKLLDGFLKKAILENKLEECTDNKQIKELLAAPPVEDAFSTKINSMFWEMQAQKFIHPDFTAPASITVDNYIDKIPRKLGEYVSKSRYLLLRGGLADFLLRALNLLYPDKVQWRDAAGVNFIGCSEPLGVLWPPRPGRSKQKEGTDPVQWKWASFGLGQRLYCFPGDIPVYTFGKMWPWMARRASWYQPTFDEA
jgi:hypothetical protein